MRIKEILTESYDADTIAEMLRKNCAPFLSQTSGVLFRGARASDLVATEVNGVFVGKTWPDRKPADTFSIDHDTANNWFQHEFGIRYRSDHVAFCTGNTRTAAAYGEACIFVPINTFTFCWSHKIRDLNDVMPSRLVPDGRRGEMVEDALWSGEYQTTNLDAAIASRCEIMLRCLEYYLLIVPTAFYNDVIGRIQ